MANITGTIKDATGGGVEDIVVRLSPAVGPAGEEQAQSGVGILRQPKEVLTDDDGTFSIATVPGFRYVLEVDAIGFRRTFVAPASDVAFHLVGLSPLVEEATPYDESDGTKRVRITIRANSIGTVRERYDEVVLERADALAGPYTEIESWTLLPGVQFYTVTDTAAPGKYYRAFYQRGGDISEKSDEVASAEADPSSLLLTVEELMEYYLFGVRLADDNGNPFPRRMLEFYIRAAEARLSKELDTSLRPVEVVNETHDHYAQDYGNWGYIQLNQWPVIDVKEVRFQYPSMRDPAIINREWVTLPDEGGKTGVLQIVPGKGNIADVLLIPGALMPLWSGQSGRVPAIWHVDYRAGFEIGQLPDDIKHVLGMWAAIGPLNIAGDLIAGAGIANKSVSLPGLSQSVGTTSSATNAGYGSRILEYQKECKELLPTLKSYYGKRRKMVVA